ncbi:hypothetical protein CC1G_09077 [Coprinopsis cinerea okayama7|uniref:Uncharacterized protein n=1 Tax=Coprinopsis cinerea (strain Okayama-7 / 130 / ATCC MYA-4618 / FGSC 9003) TaxID=240176 RepID=A8P318_COPC7|nr:hypothetical protein CC1G_09077 [Coprinopsis cinerea okayama7\|eukprot:XP_001838449.2 hypothetical protein CC1G_09077 [Coprinopsis cinerea okayama7\
MITALSAECTATYSLSKYNFHESDIEEASGHTMVVFNNDIYAAQCVTIVFCVLVATLFGADFFFLVFWPRRKYPQWYNGAKKGLAVGITMGMAAAALMSTIIITTHAAFVVGPDESTIVTMLQRFDWPPLVYRRYPHNIAWMVLIWIAFVSTLASTVLMFMAAAHDERHGTSPYPRDTVDDRSSQSTQSSSSAVDVGNGSSSLKANALEEKAGARSGV